MKKRIISVLISVCLILTVFSSATFATETVKTYHTVYLNTALETDGDGSQATPYNTLVSAINAIENSSENAGIINVVGTLTVSADMPAHTKEITYTGEGIFNYTANLAIGGPTVFQNIAIKVGTSSSAWLMLRTAGNALTFGEGITKASGSASFNITAGANVSGKDIDLTLLSGSFNSVYIGSYSDSAITINKTNFFVGEKATVSSLTLGANGAGSCTFEGDTFITVNGNVNNMIYTTKGPKPVFNGALTLLYNHGLYRLYEISETLTSEKGVYIMDCEKKDGSYLEVTETAGEFNVIGDNDVVAYSKTDGTLFEPAAKKIVFGSGGNYKVKFQNNDIEFVNGGSEIRVKKDTTLNFAEVSYIEPDGKLFVGWVDTEGKAVSSGEFKAGTVLKAKYVDYSDTDFVIKDTEIRTTSETVESQGLRFIIEKNLSFESNLKSAVGSISFGSVYMPTNYAAGTDMQIDSKHTVYTTDGKYTPKKIPAKNIYARSPSAEQYTLCITDIGSELTNDKFYKFYTVKGYIEYKDVNGVSRVLYTDYVTTNLYKVALEEKESNPDTYNTICDKIIDYVENQRIIDKTTGDGEFAFSKNYLVGNENTDPNFTIKVLNNGIRVRDIVIGTKDDSEPINIIAFSDIHFNNYNKQDELLDNPSIKAQWYGFNGVIRGMGRVDQGFGSIDNANKLMEYGSLYDKTVIIGDIMDSFSYGSAELAKKLLVDRIIKGNTLIALGNHETAELFAKVTVANGFRERFTQNYKYMKLNEQIWPHDIYYYSEVITKGDKKVKVVVIDNQAVKYNSTIYSKLSQDITASRNDGIPILIFQHVPMNTGYEDDTKIVPFGDGATYEEGYVSFYNNSGYVGGTNANADTKKVYDLICANGDVIKGIYCGHEHNSYYVPVKATDINGNETSIPQYVVSGSYMLNKGEALKISVY